ncbi:unnamed protein product [Prunus armeniaca]|uniref:Uncharacterized protein n=1 Tax=Prunus armeniaca TaxID=36596 RepID=A0A6J5XN93_PRUAR|nr:hypothetical protein GBA52_020165 [Prunus armeniaca]CAB4283432.1 unnamed protein product [Prunus armeniaca]CAB4313863.1 unnamed protein product [Prunus armeniaca]
MSSIGATYATVYVMQKRQKEVMEKKQEQMGGRSGQSSTVQDTKVSAHGRNKKVYPGTFQSPNNSPVEAKHN